jgi:lysophospholipase L1-like esterase
MRKKNVQVARKYLLAGLFLIIHTVVLAQVPFSAGTRASGGSFALHNGDRVVFVGNSLFENDLLYGYLELALTTRWPDRQVTFRNIGWTGDTVWGEARSYFTNPPTPYDLLLKQITEAKPTVVFVAYGGIEAQKGPEGIPDFVKGLDSLLDTISRLGARTVLLSPIPLFSNPTTEKSDRNTLLAQYIDEIAQRAATRGALFIDIFNPLKELAKSVALSDNGFHLNETGYYQFAQLLDKQLGGTSRSEIVSINLSRKGGAASETAKILQAQSAGALLQFELQNAYLPLPLPNSRTSQPVYTRALRITGLKKGFYSLRTNGFEVISASSDQWARGVAITQGPDYTQAERLQDLIIKKNELFFHQYRPQNRTYILGFRSYEQGRHAKGLEDLSLIITWLEGQIALHRMPQPTVYQLTPLN